MNIRVIVIPHRRYPVRRPISGHRNRHVLRIEVCLIDGDRRAYVAVIVGDIVYLLHRHIIFHSGRGRYVVHHDASGVLQIVGSIARPVCCADPDSAVELVSRRQFRL